MEAKTIQLFHPSIYFYRLIPYQGFGWLVMDLGTAGTTEAEEQLASFGSHHSLCGGVGLVHGAA